MPELWSQRRLSSYALWPLSLVYRLLFSLRGLLYRLGALHSQRMPVPVIVVGNVVAGGGGKTPTVIAVVSHLRARGMRPGVISRGYGRSSTGVREVTAHSSPQDVGDEPLLIYKAFSPLAGVLPAQAAPVFVATRRVDAARALLAAHPQTDVLVCDDGLQHLALARDVEIVVFGDAGLGNGWLLPAGPLREPWPRRADMVLNTGAAAMEGFKAQRSLAAYAVRANGTQVALESLHGTPLVALAGIARPESFFSMLRGLRLTLSETVALPDHYNFDSWPRNQYAGKQLVCTEKDAVKLWQHVPEALAVPLVLTPEPAFFAALDGALAGK
jgi:tetraacyldisaccharide 4'-kinase